MNPEMIFSTRLGDLGFSRAFSSADGATAIQTEAIIITNALRIKINADRRATGLAISEKKPLLVDRYLRDAIEVDGDQPINVRATFTGAWRRPSADELSHIAAGTWPGVQVGA